MSDLDPEAGTGSDPISRLPGLIAKATAIVTAAVALSPA
jgi:hypothetical protein